MSSYLVSLFSQDIDAKEWQIPFIQSDIKLLRFDLEFDLLT